jgi:hypothetical protein
MNLSPLIGQIYREEEMSLLYPHHQLTLLEGDNKRYADDFTETRIVWMVDVSPIRIYICKY